MKNTIIDLWNGNLSPCNDSPYRKKEISDLVKLIDRHKESLIQELSETEKELIKKIDECQFELTLLETEDAFVKGFTLGMRLAFESNTIQSIMGDK